MARIEAGLARPGNEQSCARVIDDDRGRDGCGSVDVQLLHEAPEASLDATRAGPPDGDAAGEDQGKDQEHRLHAVARCLEREAREWPDDHCESQRQAHGRAQDRAPDDEPEALRKQPFKVCWGEGGLVSRHAGCWHACASNG
jgi:hypothetical protein